MIQIYHMKKVFPFKEFTSVKITKAFHPLFDVEYTSDENLLSYCQNLMDKIFKLQYSEISNFIRHHCSIAKNPIVWLNHFEVLILENENLFKNDGNEIRLIKFQTCIEVKKYELNSEKSRQSLPRPNIKEINAESQERYFSFREVKEQLEKINSFEEKIVFLTHQKYDYQQSVIDFVNPNLPKFNKQCDKEIKRLKEINELELSSHKVGTKVSSASLNKIKINSNINQFVDVFFQLNRELHIEGKPFLDGNTRDFAMLISNNFIDKDGQEISYATVETILRPSRYDKRPKSHRRINVDKFIK